MLVKTTAHFLRSRLQAQVLKKGIKMVRRHYPSITTLLADFPSTSVLVNCSALGSLHLEDVKDTNLYPTRGQTILTAEPKTPIERMYLRTPKRIDPTVAYVVSSSSSQPSKGTSKNEHFMLIQHPVSPPQRRWRDLRWKPPR